MLASLRPMVPDWGIKWGAPAADLTAAQKRIVRAVWDTGYDLSVTGTYAGHQPTPGTAFDFAKNGAWSPEIYEAWRILDEGDWAHKKWEGDIGIGIPSAHPHIHVNTGGGGRFIETLPAGKGILRKGDYELMKPKVRRFYGAGSIVDEIKDAVTDAGEKGSNFGTGLLWLGAAALLVSLLKSYAGNRSYESPPHTGESV